MKYKCEVTVSLVLTAFSFRNLSCAKVHSMFISRRR